MIVLYIIIGIAVGAVALYLLMDRKMDHLRIEGGKTGMELKLKNEQLAETTSRVRHLEGGRPSQSLPEGYRRGGRGRG